IMARVLEVCRSGYYAWLKRKPADREVLDIVLKALILTAHKRSRETYGTLRIQAELASLDHHAGRDHISRLRKELKLRCRQRRKFTATTNSKHNFPVVPNLLDQKFDIPEPGMVWGTDITYIPTDEGWLYLAGVKDFGSREIVGFAMDKRMTQELTREALRKALSFRKPLDGCIHHSDRGSQYCAHEYQGDVKKAGLIASMSRKGNCYDNAPTESFWGSLKQELVHHYHFKTRAAAQAAIQEYIAIFYNRMRRHSSIGYMAPSIYAESFNREKKSA
ncbi:MAG: IS3 family transposase, partial [Rectinemataceae bacterium]